jgi:hypothetical protein
MVRTAERTPSLVIRTALVVLALLTLGAPQPGLAQTQPVAQASDHGRWVWNQDHWVWVEKPAADLRGTGISQAGVADAQVGPLREAGLTLRRTIAVAMSAP